MATEGEGTRADFEDVLQRALLRAYRRRGAYDPALGAWEQWFYAFFLREVLNEQRQRQRRTRRVDLAVGELPELMEGSSPEEVTMMRRLLEKCRAAHDAQVIAIVLARDVDGMNMKAIAAAHQLSLSTAYAHDKEGKHQLRQALEREQEWKRGLGLAVLPLSVEQLLAAESEPPRISEDTTRRVWNVLDRRKAADKAARLLGDDGAKVERCVGVPGAARRVSAVVRSVRAVLVSGVSHALVGGMAAGITYAAIKRAPADHPVQTATITAHLAPAMSTGMAAAPVPAPPAVHVLSAAPSVSAPPLTRTTPQEDFNAEMRRYNKATVAYQSQDYQQAIRVLHDQAARFPRGQWVGPREKLLTRALLGAGRMAEARARIEQLHRTNLTSPSLRDFDDALLLGRGR